MFPVFIALAVASIFSAMYLLSHRQRLPDLPTLKISTRPGKQGAADDGELYAKDSMKVFEAGYQQYSKRGQNYLVQTPTRKDMVIAPKFFEEVVRTSDEYISTNEANNETMQFTWTLSDRVLFEHWHTEAPLKRLTNSLGPRLPDILDEGQLAFADNMGSPTQWTAIPLMDVSFRIVTRTANRLLFGMDLARNEEFLQLSIDYTSIMFGGASLIKNYPDFLKSLILWWKTPIRQSQNIAMKHLVPLFTKRLAEKQRYLSEGREDEWGKVKPADSVQWVLDAAPPRVSMRDLTYRMLHLNVAAAHTSTTHYVDMVYVLSLLPKVVEELREEIERVFSEEGGWTKQVLTHLVKIDSFMTEVSRFCSTSAVKLKRVALKDWRLSDGTLVPKGTLFYANHLPYVFDDDTIEEARSFDHLRMYRKRQEKGQENKHQYVMASHLNQTFGVGRHACPGRFFASNEIKTLLVLCLMRYDVRMKSPATLEDVFRGRWFNDIRFPIPDLTVEYRERETPILEHLQKLF